MDSWLQLVLTIVGTALGSSGLVIGLMKLAYESKIRAAELAAEERKQANELIAKISDGKQTQILSNQVQALELTKQIAETQQQIASSLATLTDISKARPCLVGIWDGEERRKDRP